MSEGRELFQQMPFPFEGAGFLDRLGAVVQRTVLDGEQPAREVVHSADGSWMFDDGINDPNGPGAVVATHIAHAIEYNTSIASLSTMPPGQMATRRGPGDPWLISEHRWDEEL